MHEQVYNSIIKCDIDIRKDMYQNLAMSGDTVMCPGDASSTSSDTETV